MKFQKLNLEYVNITCKLCHVNIRNISPLNNNNNNNNNNTDNKFPGSFDSFYKTTNKPEQNPNISLHEEFPPNYFLLEIPCTLFVNDLPRNFIKYS